MPDCKAFSTVLWQLLFLIFCIILSWCLISWKDMKNKSLLVYPHTNTHQLCQYPIFSLSITVFYTVSLCPSTKRIKLYLFFSIISNIFPYNINKSFFALLLWASSFRLSSSGSFLFFLVSLLWVDGCSKEKSRFI